MIKQRGFTLIEVLVVMAIGGVVFGMVIDALINTDRASTALVQHQQMRQQALVISNSIEKALRQGIYDVPQARGGAAPTTAAGGGTTVSQIPKSLSMTGITTAVMESSTPGPAPTSPTQARSIMLPRETGARAQGTTVPASIQSLFTTSPAESAPMRATTSSVSQEFGADRILFSTLAFGLKKGTSYEIASEAIPGAHHVVVRDTATSAPRKLGVMSDAFQAQVSFRYAETFNGLDAVWAPTAARPRLVEYTVKVWPVKSKYATFETAIADDGRKERFSLTTAVALP